MKRTQGPWSEPRCYPGRTKGSTERICIYGNEGRTLVAEIRPMCNGHTEEAKANFAIIAKAPELLEALHEIHKMWLCPQPKTLKGWSARCDVIADFARAAIAKATGEVANA